MARLAGYGLTEDSLCRIEDDVLSKETNKAFC